MQKVLLTSLGVCLLAGAGLLVFSSPRAGIETATGSAEVQTITAPSAEEHIYWTWDTMEFDKCVTAWVISRFVDHEAVIRFYSKDEPGKGGVPFDVPGAARSRQPGKCGTEVILEAAQIDDSALKKIASFARVTELARWQIDEYPEAREHFANVRAIIDAQPLPDEAFGHVAAYLDELYAQLSSPASDR